MKKKIHLRKWVKEFLIITLFFLIMIAAILQLYKMDQDFIKKCTAIGYSEQYCIEHK